MAAFLRKYYYLDEDFINDNYATIFGYDLDEQQITTMSESQAGGKVGVTKVVSVEASAGQTFGDTVKINANKTTSAKLQDIINYIEKESGESIPYYQQLNEDIFSNLNRDDIFEGVFNLSFTKIEQVSELASIATSFGSIPALGCIIDSDTEEKIDAIKTIAEKERAKGISCILKFVDDDKKFHCYCRLENQFLKTQHSHLQGEVTMICKVSRIIPKGKTVNLSDITELSKLKVPNTNTQQGRKQQVQQIKSGKKNTAKDFQDEIKGPAIEVVPIAIYK